MRAGHLFPPTATVDGATVVITTDRLTTLNRPWREVATFTRIDEWTELVPRP